MGPDAAWLDQFVKRLGRAHLPTAEDRLQPHVPRAMTRVPTSIYADAQGLAWRPAEGEIDSPRFTVDAFKLFLSLGYEPRVPWPNQASTTPHEVEQVGAAVSRREDEARTKHEAISLFAAKFGPLRVQRKRPREDYGVWIDTANLCLDALTIAAALRSNRLGPDYSWRRLLGSSEMEVHGLDLRPSDDGKPNRYRVAFERLTLGQFLDALLRDAEVTLGTSWAYGATAPSYTIHARTLYAAIVLRLVASIIGGGFVPCSACGLPHPPKRPNNKGRNSYCDDCGRRAAMRLARQKYEAGKRASRGSSPNSAGR